MWAWYQYGSARRRKPDLRFAGHLPKGTKGVRLECRVAVNRILLSDFELWHYVLNGWYLADSEADSRAFERMEARAKPSDRADIQRRITASWVRIFDIDWCDPDHWVANPFEEKGIQATLWELRKEDIVRVTEFVAR